MIGAAMLTNSAVYGSARNCYIPMPFKRSARLTITNLGKKPSLHWFEVDYRSYRQRAETSGILPCAIPPRYAAARRAFHHPRGHGARPFARLRSKRQE